MAARSAFRLNSRPIFAAAGLTSLAYLGYNRSFTASAAADATAAPNKVFKASFPSFVSLKLQSAEQINHDTKKLRFELPSENDVCGISVICKWCSGPRPPFGRTVKLGADERSCFIDESFNKWCLDSNGETLLAHQRPR